MCTCVFVFEKNTLDGSGWNFAAGLRDGPDYACSGSELRSRAQTDFGRFPSLSMCVCLCIV